MKLAFPSPSVFHSHCLRCLFPSSVILISNFEPLFQLVSKCTGAQISGPRARRSNHRYHSDLMFWSLTKKFLFPATEIAVQKLRKASTCATRCAVSGHFSIHSGPQNRTSLGCTFGGEAKGAEYLFSPGATAVYSRPSYSICQRSWPAGLECWHV